MTWSRLFRGLAGLVLCANAAAQPAHIESVHQDLSVELDPATRELRVSAQIGFEGSGVARLGLGDGFAVEAVAVDGDPVAVAPARESGLRVWALELKNTGRHQIVVRYSGTLQALPEIDHRATLQRLPPMAGTEGSYLPGGTGWYPLLGEQQFTYRLHLKLPPGQRGLVPGRLVAEETDARGYRAEYEFSHPAESIELMAGPYEVRERVVERPGGPPVHLRTWFHPELHDLASGYLDAVEGYLRLYSEWIGAYPFTEFSVVSSPLPTGFGMPTLTYLGIDVLRLPFIKSTSLGHEVLHNWWGNGVYVDYERGNWCEGLTTFMADYFYKEQEGASAAYATRQTWLRDFAAIPVGQDTPLTAFTARSHGTSQIVGYHKAAYLFLMLCERIGAATFDAGLREFWQQHRFARAGWDDLRRAFERSSGETLDVLFEQWLTRTGAPRVRIEDASRDGNTLHMRLAQDGPAYVLRVPLAIDTAEGPKTLAVDLTCPSQAFTLQLDATPRTVALDPQLLLFRRLEPSELPPILRQVMLDPATHTVVASRDSAVAAVARELASKLQDSVPRFDREPTGAPLLVIGAHADVDRFLAEHDLPARPETVRGRGTAQVWTATQPSGAALAVVSAADVSALRGLLRPLPHYGGQSWLVFEGAKVVERGVWPGESVVSAVD